jgi:hypothetical protein
VGYQVKGVANYVTEGPDYEMMKQKIKDRLHERGIAKGCAIMTVTEVYDISYASALAGKELRIA